MNPVNQYRPSASIPIHKDLTFLRQLHVKDSALMEAAIAARESSNQKDAALGVDLDFTVTEFGNRHRDLPPTRAFHDFVHEFLRESVEHD